jgi:type III restriction enzyme
VKSLKRIWIPVIAFWRNPSGRKLQAGEFVHTFDRHEIINKAWVGYPQSGMLPELRKMKIIKVVFFKMNLFHRMGLPACRNNDVVPPLQVIITYIAQLLGRMIRTPLAHRVDSDAELNNVGLFLPFFD